MTMPWGKDKLKDNNLLLSETYTPDIGSNRFHVNLVTLKIVD